MRSVGTLVNAALSLCSTGTRSRSLNLLLKRNFQTAGGISCGIKLTLLERSMLASELLLDPPDLEDRAEKSSRFFLATDKLLPEVAEAAVLACPPSVEDELWREGDRWIVGGEDLAVIIPGERSSSTELPRSEKSIRIRH